MAFSESTCDEKETARLIAWSNLLLIVNLSFNPALFPTRSLAVQLLQLPKMSPRLISVIGSLNMDIITYLDHMPDPGESLTAIKPLMSCPGGKGSNQAMAAHRLSRNNPASPMMMKFKDGNAWSQVEVHMIGRIGHDDYGKQIIAGMKRAGLSSTGVKPVENLATGVAVILVEHGTGESRVLLHPGANHSLRPSEFKTLQSLTGGRIGEPIRKPDLLVLQLEIPRDTVEKILETARREKVEVLLNAAPATNLLDPAWEAVTHLVVNETEGAALLGKNIGQIEELMKNWGEFTDEFLDRGVKNVVVTLGGKGAYYSSAKGKGGLCQAKKVEVVDTTTAGDTFVGAYAVQVVSALERGGGWEIDKAVQWSCDAATCAVKVTGTQESIPWMDEV
jgi:ribokinase